MCVCWIVCRRPSVFVSCVCYVHAQIGLKGYLVGAMDDEMLQTLVKLDINTWRMNTGITKKDLGWGSQNFHEMGR